VPYNTASKRQLADFIVVFKFNLQRWANSSLLQSTAHIYKENS